MEPAWRKEPHLNDKLLYIYKLYLIYINVSLDEQRLNVCIQVDYRHFNIQCIHKKQTPMLIHSLINSINHFPNRELSCIRLGSITVHFVNVNIILLRRASWAPSGFLQKGVLQEYRAIPQAH